MTERPYDLTWPMVEPSIDVLEDLLQLSHLTWSYAGRAFGGALLLAYAMLENGTVGLVIAALFVPFMSEVLAAAFGLWSRDRGLRRTGAIALAVSVALSVAAGAVIALVHGGPMQFQDFKPPMVSFALSCVIGVAAGLSATDDAGRRYLIGVAAAIQYAIYPVWIGIDLVIGFPDRHTVLVRLATFAINVATIAGSAVLAFTLLGVRPPRFWSRKQTD